MEKRSVYANLLCDFMFKRMFGSENNKDVLIWFLNLVLQDVDIVHVDFIRTEQHGLTEEDRKVIFDIACECRDGSKFIIEMQKGYQKHFRERALYYTSYPINEQGRIERDKYEQERKSGMHKGVFRWDYNLKPVTVVAILNFRFEHDERWPMNRYHSSYRLREDCTGEVMTEVLRFVFLELGRFKKGLHELETVFDKWIYLLKHMHHMNEIPKEFSEPMFERLFLLAKIANFTPTELRHYYKSLENMGDYYNIINTATEDAEKRGHQAGLEEGLVQGREEGREEKQQEIAMRFLQMGLPVEQVMQGTGLTKEQVEQLRKQ